MTSVRFLLIVFHAISFIVFVKIVFIVIFLHTSGKSEVIQIPILVSAKVNDFIFILGTTIHFTHSPHTQIEKKASVN